MNASHMRKFKIQKCRVKVQGQGSRVKVPGLLSLVPFPLTLASFLILLFSFFILNFPVLAAWFGLEDCPNHWEESANVAGAIRFQAPEDGISTHLEMRTYSSNGIEKSTFRMAVYDDENAHPDSKLWEGTDIAYVAGEWCGEDVAAIQLEKDVYYWFSFKFSVVLDICYVPDGPPYSHEWKTGQPYGNPFPDPWGNYSGRNANRCTLRMHYETEKKGKGIIEIDPGIIEGGFVR